MKEGNSFNWVLVVGGVLIAVIFLIRGITVKVQTVSYDNALAEQAQIINGMAKYFNELQVKGILPKPGEVFKEEVKK